MAVDTASTASLHSWISSGVLLAAGLAFAFAALPMAPGAQRAGPTGLGSILATAVFRQRVLPSFANATHMPNIMLLAV